MEDRVARLLVAVLGNAGEVKTIEHLNRFMAALDVLAEQILPLAVNYCSNLSSDRNSVWEMAIIVNLFTACIITDPPM